MSSALIFSATGIACKNTGRKFIGIEKDAGYFEIAKQRIGL
jgi:DNA modification methylase